MHLASVGKVDDEAILIAALLHDTIEDTDTTVDEVRDRFGEEVAFLVMECTDDKSLPKQERKRLQVVNAPNKSVGAKQIKIADKTCNLRTLIDDPPIGWDSQRLKEYVLWAESVVSGLKGVNSDLDAVVDRVIEKAQAEFA